MSIDQAAMIRAIYDTIFAAYTQPPAPGLPAVGTPEDLFLTLEWPGQQLDPSQFQNPWSPQNPQGSPTATEYFANSVNAVPALSATYRDSGVTVEEVYKELLLLTAVDTLTSGENPLANVFLDAKKTFEFSQLSSAIDPMLFYHPAYATPGDWYDEAASQSWAQVIIRSSQLRDQPNSPFTQTGGIEQVKLGVWKVPSGVVAKIDPATIRRLKQLVPADPSVRSRILARAQPPTADVVKSLPTYSTDQLNYQNAQDEYDNAVANLNANRFQYDLLDPAQKQQWDKLAPNLEAAVQSTWNRLQQTPQVDLERVQPQVVLREPPILDRKPNVPINSAPPNSRIAPLNALILDRIPSGVEKVDPKGVELARRRLDNLRVLQKPALNYEALRQYLQIKDDSLDSETSNLEISFRFCRVAIRRPWLQLSLLKLMGWHMVGQPAGSLSNGHLVNNPGLLPLLPTAFIAIRDLQIRGTWSQKDRSIAELSTAGSGNVGFGPFALSGRYGTDQAGNVYTARFDGQTLSAPGLQILGWINQLIPFSPPSAG